MVSDHGIEHWIQFVCLGAICRVSLIFHLFKFCVFGCFCSLDFHFLNFTFNFDFFSKIKIIDEIYIC